MRKLWFVLAILLFAAHAEASTILVDLSGVGTTEDFFGPCYCENSIYYSPIITVAPGNVVDFGHVTIHFVPVGAYS
jgi:esterase/lipase superfamily enzyme